jgi:uncharacterized protein YbaR (Trm112 family)
MIGQCTHHVGGDVQIGPVYQKIPLFRTMSAIVVLSFPILKASIGILATIPGQCYIYRNTVPTKRPVIERKKIVHTEDASIGKGAIPGDLLAILCCPETKQEVCALDPAVVERLNQRIAKGELKTKGGQSVTEKIDGGLLRKDKTVAYPIRDQIPIMLIEEGLLVEQSDLSPS